MLNGMADTEITLILFSNSTYHFGHDKELRLGVLEEWEIQDLKIIILSCYSSWRGWPFKKIHSDAFFKIYLLYYMKVGHIVVSQGKVGRIYTFFPRTVKKFSWQI